MIDYLLIGHVSIDLTPEGAKPGGAVTFASHVACELGYKTAVLTSASPIFDLRAAFPDDVEVVCLPSAQTTTFENIYASDGSRRQRLHAVANTIGASDIPPEWRSAKIVHLAPIAEEIEPAIIDAFPGSMICTTPQGWLRGWDRRGNVFAEPAPHITGILSRTSVIVVSQEDLVSQFQVELARQFVPLIVVTNGGKDSVVYCNNDEYVLTPPPVQAVDATGAGDTFATALFIRLHQTGGDIRDAAQFATYLAARSITRSVLAEKITEIRRAIDDYDKGVDDFG